MAMIDLDPRAQFIDTRWSTPAGYQETVKVSLYFLDSAEHDDRSRAVVAMCRGILVM
jgi:hypothetical protein